MLEERETERVDYIYFHTEPLKGVVYDLFGIKNSNLFKLGEKMEEEDVQEKSKFKRVGRRFY